MAQNNFLVFIFFVPLLYLIFNQLKSLFTRSSKKIPPFPPGPKPWPIIGNIPQMANKMPHVALSDLSKIHGPLFMLRLGTQKMVVASSPAAAKEIFTTHDRILSTRYVLQCNIPTQEVLNKCSIGWAEATSDGWKTLRTLSRTELFSSKALDAQSFLKEKKVSEMIEHVKSSNKNRHDVINIGELVFVTAYNILCNVLLSRDLIGFDEKNEDGGMKGMLREIFENALAPNISDFYPILSGLDLQGIRRNAKRIEKRVESIFEPIIVERRKSNKATMNSQHDYLDVLLLNNFSNFQIHQMLMELIAAGTDTSTSTVEWAMAELILNPESMKKVIQEIDEEVGRDQRVKESHIPQLTYLQAVINETLRLHPPGPLLLPRKAVESCQVINYTIPKNAQVYINIWAMGRDPLIWDDPLTFRPERFLNSAADFKALDFEYIPFGAGRRTCPGLPMGKRHVSLILAALLHSFEWSLADGMSSKELDMTETFGITLHKKKPLLLIPKPRN